ncbi:hypothetical protein MRX96_014422 [Rhipicephalus microplus]
MVRFLGRLRDRNRDRLPSDRPSVESVEAWSSSAGSLASGNVIEDLKDVLERLKELEVGKKVNEVIPLPKIDVDVYVDAESPLAVNFSREPTCLSAGRMLAPMLPKAWA